MLMPPHIVLADMGGMRISDPVLAKGYMHRAESLSLFGPVFRFAK